MTTAPDMSPLDQELVTIVTEDGKIKYQSPTIDEMLGYTHTALQDEEFLSAVHPDDRDRVKTLFDELFADSGTRIQRIEYRFRKKSHSWAWIESIGTRREDMIVLTSRNITQRKEKQQQATVLHRILRHNLRNELNIIMFQAETLADAQDPDQVRESAEVIMESTSKLDQLAENARVMGEFLDTPHGHQESQELTRIVSELVAECRSQYPSVEFDVALPDAQHVLGSRHLDIAVRHVLENAIQHNNADNPRVKVRMSSQAAHSDEVELAISDSGPGIPEQERAVLVEGKETPLQHSSGIGLWIVNWIISHCGGRIEFERSQFGGSRVALILPVPSAVQ